MATIAKDAPQRSSGYQMLLVALLSLNFGIVFFDRNSLNFLMPFVQPELRLTNTQVGMLASALSLTWALAAMAIGKVSDATGNRKVLLIGSTVLFSVCSFLTGIAQSFVMLLGARLLMGAAEGGVMPISHAMVADQVSPERRGLAQGIAQNFGSNLLGSFVAPVLLVAFANAFGWRHSFFLAGAPGIISAAILWFVLKDSAIRPETPAEHARSASTLQVLMSRNVAICCGMGVLLVAYFVTCLAFMPLYLDQVLHVSKATNSWLMGTLGISATIGSFAISGLSDRIGRRPVMIAIPLIALILPLGALYWHGSVWVLAALFFVGWAVNGIFPLFMATVPSESVDEHHVATALGLAMGISEVVGGVFAPSVAGWFADRSGLTAPLWMMVGLTLAGALLATFLIETAPSRRKA